MRRLIGPLTAALALTAQPLLAAPAPGTPFVFSRPALATTVFPRVAQVADLDADGRPDIVSGVGNSCCPTSIGVSVMLAREGGFFDPAAVYETPTLADGTGQMLPDDLEILDVDGDGALDVIASVRIDNAEPGTYTAVALPGRGDGSFGAATRLPFPTFKVLEVGNLRQGDGLIAVVARASETQLWQLSSGFDFVHTGNLSGIASDLLAQDLDADGTDELLAYQGPLLRLYRELAPGALASIPDVRALRAADVSGDGLPEVLATQAGGAVQVLGQDLATVRTLSAGGGGLQANAGELDGDGLADVVRANSDSSVTVFFGKGGVPVRVPLTHSPSDVFVLDATGDAAADILALETDASIIEVLEGDGAGGFPAQRPTRPTAPGHVIVEHGDFNGDGKPDLVTGPWYPFFDGALAGFAARVALGDGNGGLTQSAALNIDGAVSGIAVADVNGDGNDDVVVSEYYAATSFFLGNGDGTFGPRVPVATCYFNDGLVAGDFNSDGYGDVAFVCNSIIYRNTLTIALGSPGGLVRTPEIPIANANQTYVLRTGDVNGDGNEDIALGGLDYFASSTACLPDPLCLLQRSDGPVTYFVGLGNGVFEPVTRGAPTGARFYDLALEDVDGDGRDDLLTTMLFEDSVVIQPGKADGTVGEAVRVPTYDYPTVLRVADVTGDGEKDLVMSHGPSILSVHAGADGVAFEPPTSYAYRSAFGELVVGNYSGDEGLDVLAGLGSGVEVFTNGA